MITFKDLLLHLHIPCESKIQKPNFQSLQWERKRITEIGVARNDEQSVVNQNHGQNRNQDHSKKDTPPSAQEKDRDRIIKETLQSNTHL